MKKSVNGCILVFVVVALFACSLVVTVMFLLLFRLEENSVFHMGVGPVGAPTWAKQ